MKFEEPEDQGKKAFMGGKTVYDCPYSDDEHNKDRWVCGFLDAKWIDEVSDYNSKRL
jgi:ribosome modulation factor